MKIRLKNSMIFDAICTCDHLCYPGNHLRPEQREVLETLLKGTGDIFKEGCLSCSNVCALVSRCIYDPESATLNDLYSFFCAIKEETAEKSNGEGTGFVIKDTSRTASILREGYADTYKKYILALREAGFENVWKEKILPIEQYQMQRLGESFGDTDIDAILAVISELKNTPFDKDVSVYVSLMSYPISFRLSKNAFLDTVNNSDGYFEKGFLSMIAHELMHGFASEELKDLYLSFVKSERYLYSTHKALIVDMLAGNEEEFVMAAEYYIMHKCGLMSKDEIIKRGLIRYSGCVPISLYLFDVMLRNEEKIKDLNSYLTHLFREDKLSHLHVIPTIDSLLPEPIDEDGFYTSLFAVLRRCAYVIRDAQVNFPRDIKSDIESLTGSSFSPNECRTVSFACGRTELDESCISREILRCDSLTVERLEFEDKRKAFSLSFPCRGSNVGAFTLRYKNEVFRSPYTVNVAYSKSSPIRAEFSFVCANARYLVTSDCPDGVTELENDAATCRSFGKDIIEAARKAERIIMLMNDL